MSIRTVAFTTELPFSADMVYAWHTRPGAMERLVPYWEELKVLDREGVFGNGSVTFEVGVGPLRSRWKARYRDPIPGRQFTDVQEEGPFAHWVHTHAFEPVGADRCRVVDRIEYELPFGPAGELASSAVEHRIARAFAFRHTTLHDDLVSMQQHRHTGPRNIVMSGATGLIGRTLIPMLTAMGFRVKRLVRGEPSWPEDIPWDPGRGRLDPTMLEGVEAVIHLSGESIAGGRWTAERKREIMESRRKGTTLLAETLGRLTRPPRVMISASAIGIYGDRGDEWLVETSPLRTGPEAFFVEQVGHAWEAATEPAERAGIRVVRTRFGLVLTPAGGALHAMLPAFQAGVGGRMGTGEQWMSWVSIDDVLGALHHVLLTETMRGPVNVTAPNPVRNSDFAHILGSVLHRPSV
ncbi:MAG TPA: TIGR01777 family oxidoreductase, partial [Gemmatimonadales bacterium]|nr:TIGR01777 family oxidoreductase [Gemmatimonadales bacterium]